MRHQDKVNILKSLTVSDCSKIELNDNPRYPRVELYFFAKDLPVYSFGEKELISLYIKMYINIQDRYDQVVVISFHENGAYDD